jgi:hypothetical protein
LGEINARYGIGQPLAVGGDSGFAQALHLHHVLEGHGALGRRRLACGELSSSKKERNGTNERAFSHNVFLFALTNPCFSAKEKCTPERIYA